MFEDDKVQWTYGLMKADGSMDCIILKGHLPLDRLREVLGGDYKFVQFADGKTAAVRKDGDALPPNQRWPDLRGDVVLGTLRESDGVFLGALGVQDTGDGD